MICDVLVIVKLVEVSREGFVLIGRKERVAFRCRKGGGKVIWIGVRQVQHSKSIALPID